MGLRSVGVALNDSVLFVDDDPENVELIASISEDIFDRVAVVGTVEAAVRTLVSERWDIVVMDLFMPLGEHPSRTLGPRARKYQEHAEHLGGLVLLEELDRLPRRPIVISHTACTDHVLIELFGDRVARKVPKPAPLDTLLQVLVELREAT